MYFADATILPMLNLDLDYGFTPWEEQAKHEHQHHEDVQYPYQYQLHDEHEPALSPPAGAVTFPMSSPHTPTTITTATHHSMASMAMNFTTPTSGPSSPSWTYSQNTATPLPCSPDMATTPPAPTPTSGASSPALSSPQTITTATAFHLDDRRLRRRQSNKESARRSRMRIRQRQEDLEKEVALLSERNKELADKLGAVQQCVGLYRMNNRRMQAECRSLRQRLVDMQLHVLVRQLRQQQQQQHQYAANGAGGGGTNLMQQVGMMGGFGFLAENGQTLTT